MKYTVVTFISAIALACTIMAGLYTHLNSLPAEQLQAAKPQTIIEKVSPVINLNNGYAELVSQLQQQESQLMVVLEKKFTSLNETIDYVGSQVEGIAERVNRLESSQGIDSPQSGSAATSKRIETGSRQHASINPLVAEQKIRQSLNDEFSAEQVDNNFGITAQENVQTLFITQQKPVYQTSHLTSIECRSASCRVEISHDQEIDAEDFESEFLVDAAKAGFSRVRGYYSNDNGVNTGTYYLARASSSTQTNRE